MVRASSLNTVAQSCATTVRPCVEAVGGRFQVTHASAFGRVTEADEALFW
jgi:hypothetical protein